MESEDDELMYFVDESSDPEDDQYDDIDITDDPEGETGEPSVKRHMKDDDEFYDCLTPESIVVTMTKCIDEVNSVFEIPAATARILLTHFKWDKEKLLERYYTGDQDALFKEAHVVNPHRGGCSSMTLRKTKSTSSSSSSSCQLNQSICEICIRALSISDLTGLECGHVFCQECWDEYLRTKILVENTGQNIFCPATECDILVHENFVLSVVEDVSLRSRYHKLIADSFVQSNCLMKWCPAPNCNNAIKAIYNEAKPVTCLCGFLFCFGCTQPSHEPVKCMWLKRWLKKCDDDSETSNWLSANTKECPKCHVTIEKNGGCNHMVCKSSHCKMDFCWVCLGPWESHGSSWYNCNRYDEEDAQAARDAQAKSRAALERYLFYCNRYMNHLQSAKFEQKLYDQVKETMEVLQQMNMSWIEVQFLRKAVDVLSVCRNTLKYTYVFAFYLKKNNQSIIFEDNQKDLEMVTEQLSEYLERDINTEEMNDVQEMKQKVHDKYRYCEQRRIVLLDHVLQGYEDDFWEYQEEL